MLKLLLTQTAYYNRDERQEPAAGRTCVEVRLPSNIDFDANLGY